MKRRRNILNVERTWIAVLALASIVLASGCSTGPSRMQTWEGDARDAANVAVLSPPSPIKVKEVNGREMASYLLDDLEVDYELLPGKNQIVFTHKTIWSKHEAVDDGESKVHVVETERQSVTIDAKAGETYRFAIDMPETKKQAEALISDFSVDVTNSVGQVVATSTPWTAAVARQSPARAPVPESGRSADSGNVEAGSTIERLKSLWGQASEDEKREFLRWAFE
ncbi:DUF2057 family protein [Marinobacter sp. CHS3-4]|uniref:DUF2057 family protein n=1 Tax=Marinobacter sp. CHS3-4 TaxID=3045174 RepID=UPI0024B61874|nr:DUF2057 family protein [Marinobacter sp. CHS3-4]MDI9246765.1 DUF2057 family protein [Marinobacter sp. CHS3-4]